MPSDLPPIITTQHRACGVCGNDRVWIGVGVGCRVCLICDAPATPCGQDTATWEINQRRRERGEVI